MIAHIVIGLASFIMCCFLLAIAIKRYENRWFVIGMTSLFGILASVLIILWAPLTALEYNQFEVKYEIQKEMLIQYQESAPNLANNMIYIMDLLEVNQVLADYQASKLYWDWWSCLPNRVLDLEPIGY